MIRFTYDNEGNREWGNKADHRRKRRHELARGIILSIIAFSLSTAVGAEFSDRVNEMFMEIDRRHKDKLKSKEENRKQKEAWTQVLSEESAEVFRKERNDK